MSRPFSIEVAQTAAELELFAPLWSALPWEREEAELAYLLARVEASPVAEAPFAIVVRRGDEPVAGLAARLETRQLRTSFGPRVVYAPRVRVLQVADGGIVAVESGAIPQLVAALQAALARGIADIAAIPPLPLGSDLFSAFDSLGGMLGQQRFLPTWQRRLLVVPPTYEDYLASRSGKVRFGIRYDAKKLLGSLGEELRVELLTRPADHERLIHDLEQVAQLTYQRSIGAGFADTPEQRRLTQVGLEHGWLRAYVLYRSETPIAFWLCAVHSGTMLLKTTGFDPEYLRLRVGIYLLMRVIEDACGDPATRLLDFGPGDADYKRYLSGESRLERNLVLYAPTMRARRVNAIRTAILGVAAGARHASDATQLTDRLKARRRRALRT